MHVIDTIGLHHSLFVLLFALVAFMYASVGHGGASAYIVLMSLYGLAPTEAKPIVLVMNAVVSCIAFISFYRNHHFDWRMFLYLIIPSIPMVYLGSFTPLTDQMYRTMLGCIVAGSGIRLMFSQKEIEEVKPYNPYVLMITGACLGWISGLLGVGGGILLSPLLFFLGWAKAKTISGLSAAFILVNSVTGLLAQHEQINPITTEQTLWILVVVFFGFLGAQLGVRRIDYVWIRRILGLVLLVASMKFFLS